MAIRPVNSLSHYTDWTVGHVHSGALGWVAFITFGAMYSLVPWLWKQKQMYSPFLVELHFWFALTGIIIYLVSLWNAGITQGLMWRTYNEAGSLTYSFHDSMVAMYPYYFARGIGGLMYLTGALIAFYNIIMTIRVSNEPQPDFVNPDMGIHNLPNTAQQVATIKGAGQ